MDLKEYIRSIPDYPKKGILFRDITTLIKDEKAFANTIDKIIEISIILSMQPLNAFSSLIRVVISLNNIPFLG